MCIYYGYVYVSVWVRACICSPLSWEGNRELGGFTACRHSPDYWLCSFPLEILQQIWTSPAFVKDMLGRFWSGLWTRDHVRVALVSCQVLLKERKLKASFTRWGDSYTRVSFTFRSGSILLANVDFTFILWSLLILFPPAKGFWWGARINEKEIWKFSWH